MARERNCALAAAADSAKGSVGKGLGAGCGKIVLLGEYAVLYGFHALALGGLPLGITATVTPSSKTTELIVPAWNLSLPVKQSNAIQPAAAVQNILEALGLWGQPLRVSVDVCMPTRCGLGSSAAYCVAICRAAANSCTLRLSLQQVVEVAQRAEQIFHKKSSGLDCAAAATNGVILYRNQAAPEITSISARLPFLVLGILERKLSTQRLIGDIEARREGCPRRYARIFKRIDCLVKHATLALKHSALARLGQLMDENHLLLCELGVSTLDLDAAVSAARQSGALGAKLTGAGGGGAIIALCSSAAAAAAVSDTLHQRGLQTLVVPGLMYVPCFELWPAALAEQFKMRELMR